MLYQKVLCAGTFDHYHLGHQFYLWQGSALGKKMVVIVARDETVERLKGRRPSQNLESRIKHLEKDFLHSATRHTPPVIRPGREDQDFYQTIREEDPDLIFLGYDQHFDETKAKALFPDITFQRCEAYFPKLFKSSYFRVQ